MRELGPLWPGAPRHVPGASFPAVRFLADLHPHPRRHPRGSLRHVPDPAPGLPEDRWREDRTYLLGIDLYHAGYLWEAHEQWEAGYFAATDPAHRDLLQALIQLAAALIQAHRGRGAGVRLLAAAVVRRLESVVHASPEGTRRAGLDPRALLSDVRRHFAPALAGADDDGAARTVGPPPRLEVAP